MGLFIGASVLTILEIFDYLYEVQRFFASNQKLVNAQVKCFTTELDFLSREIS